MQEGASIVLWNSLSYLVLTCSCGQCPVIAMACALLLCLLFSCSMSITVASDVPVKVCANTITANLSMFLRESKSINPELDSLDPANTRKLLAERHLLSKHSSSSNQFLEGASLHKVRLALDSRHGIAQHTNLKYLLMLDVDNLVYSFRNNSGIHLVGSPYGGWEAPGTELRGHFVGHYLSATSMMWASTHNSEIYRNMNAVVDALAECQERIGTGYLSAFPESFFDRYEAIHIVWAPYYTIHKIMAGLLDQYNHAGNKKALKMVTWMADYFSNRVESYIKKYTIEAHYDTLNQEVGGMNDVLYNLYRITGDPKHLKTAHLFDKPCFLGLLALQEDSISGFHANTHIPLVVGSQSRFEVTGDKIYQDLSAYFMRIVNSSHLFATGGTSIREFWVDPNRLATALDKDTEETCATYNMLKVARNLFRWTRDIQYAEYYERALTNGILTIQRRQEPGVTLYMLPLAPGSSKNSSSQQWGTQFNSFWCCYGTAIESFSKLGDSIYFEDSNNGMNELKAAQSNAVEIGGTDFNLSLYVIQFVSSNLSWDSVGLILQQTVVRPITVDNPKLLVEIKFIQDQSMNQTGKVANLNVRIPSWASSGYGAKFNAKEQAISPGSFLTIKSVFKPEDKLTLTFPATLRLEHIQDDRPQYSKMNAILFGPYLLAGLSSGDWEMGAVDVTSPSDWITPVSQMHNNHLYTFSQESKSLSEEPGNATTWMLGHRNGSLVTDNQPTSGTDWNFQSTFKVVSNGSLKHGSLIGNTISMELMDRPANFMSHDGIDRDLKIVPADSSYTKATSSAATRPASTLFKVVPGLSSKQNTVSFEAADYPRCFVSASNGPAQPLQLKCKPTVTSDVFNSAASFIVNKGVAEYHPISFKANGPKRSYLLFPLNDYTDEHYTVYFDMK